MLPLKKIKFPSFIKNPNEIFNFLELIGRKKIIFFNLTI